MSTVNVANFDFSHEFNKILERLMIYSPEIIRGDSDIARVLGVSRTTPSTWRKRGKLPLEAIVDYAQKMEVNIHWLLTGEGEPTVSQMSTSAKEQLHDIALSVYMNNTESSKRLAKRDEVTSKEISEISRYINESLAIDASNPHNEIMKEMLFKLALQTDCDKDKLSAFIDCLSHQELSMVPEYNVQVSAGHGVINDNEKPIRHLAFKKNWLQSRGFKPQDLVIVSARGDSMEGTISNNDSLLIHTKSADLHDGNIYVIRQNDALLVKRVQLLLNGDVKLISDNSTYEPMVLCKNSCDDLNVIGQVVWIAKDIS